MRDFWKRHWKDILLSLGMVLAFAGVLWLNYPTYKAIKECKYWVSDNKTAQPNITLDHIDKDGTIWIEIGGNLYYLCMSDNGTQKRLEMK